MMRATALFTALSAALAAAPLHAQVVPVESFAKHAEVNEVALSPDGKYIAMTLPTPDGKETQLMILPLDGKDGNKLLRFGKDEHVSDIYWTANDRVTLARATQVPLEPRPYSRGQLFSTDVNGKNQKTLFGYFATAGLTAGRRQDEGFAWVAKVLDDEPGKALIGFRCWNCGENPDTAVYRVDTATGERKEIDRAPRAAHPIFDQSGRARIQVGADDDDVPVMLYRRAAGDAWAPMPKALAGYRIDNAVFLPDGNTVIAELTDAGEPPAWYRLDLAAGTRAKLDYKPGFESAAVLRSGRNGAPFAVITNAGKPAVQYFDPQSEMAQLHAGLSKAFPGQLVMFDNFTLDNRKLLFHVASDRHPAAWYIVDRDTNGIRLIAESMPWIKPAEMAPVTPFEFKARDGETIHGFITTKDNRPRPMIVMPHGGPHGVNDAWGFDDDAQFFANRGYAVLQVNYRGSGGRGVTFMQSGYRQWGGKMQDDLADGVKWAVDNKLADPARVCTYGSSYGGYAALMQTIRYPELYKCAIGYVGVYDLQVMKKRGDIIERRSGRRYLDRVLGTDDAQLQAWSPARNVDKIKVPVLLAQGSIDQRVPMDQFNALKNAFRANGTPVETMVADGEGHGFYKPENIAELYRRMEAFLAKHIGPGVK